MATTNIRAFELARDSWAQVNLSQAKASLGAKRTAIQDAEKNGVARRKQLISEYKSFREAQPEAKLILAKRLLKQLMGEVDTLTLRAQAAERSQTELLENLEPCVDPVRLASLAIQCVSTVDKLQPQLEQLSRENKSLLQSDTARAARIAVLECEVADLTAGADQVLLEKGQAMEDEMNDRIREARLEAEATEAQLEAALETAQVAQAAAEMKVDELQNDLFAVQEKHNAQTQARDQEMAEAAEENSTLRARLAVVSQEVEALRQQNHDLASPVARNSRGDGSANGNGAGSDSTATLLHESRLDNMRLRDEVSQREESEAELQRRLNELSKQLEVDLGVDDDDDGKTGEGDNGGSKLTAQPNTQVRVTSLEVTPQASTRGTESGDTAKHESAGIDASTQSVSETMTTTATSDKQTNVHSVSETLHRLEDLVHQQQDVHATALASTRQKAQARIAALEKVNSELRAKATAAAAQAKRALVDRNVNANTNASVNFAVTVAGSSSPKDLEAGRVARGSPLRKPGNRSGGGGSKVFTIYLLVLHVLVFFSLHRLMHHHMAADDTPIAARPNVAMAMAGQTSGSG